jgi:hypothetical protein
MRTKTRIAATAATGLIATVLMASPGFAASAQAAAGTGPQVGTCDRSGDRLQDRDRDHVRIPGTGTGTGAHLYLRTHRS